MIHLLSDVHLERGPYTLPPDFDFDVLVAAGDISDKPEQAIDFLKAVGKPVVMVLGNHDYWSGRLHGLFGASEDAGSVDMADRLAEYKRLAAGTNIHVLEQESVILRAGGKRVRFLGATLWTSYGNGNAALMEIGAKTMNDTSMIGAGSWIGACKKNAKTYQSWRKAASVFYDPAKIERRFEPPVALDIHTKTVKWLERQLKRQGDWDHTVVVTHHWPSWEALVTVHAVRQPEIALDPEYWKRNTHRPDREDLGVNRLAGYGSPMEAFIQRYRRQIDAWCCGHLHNAIDTGLHGVRLTCNPRGYPFNKDDNLGNGPGFDERKLIELEAGVMPALLPQIEVAAKEIDVLMDELGLLARYVNDESDAYQCAIMRETFDSRCREINKAAERIARHINANLQVDFDSVIGAANVWARWSKEDPDPEYAREEGDAAGEAIRAARRFLYHLRRIPRKPAQFERVQARMVTRAVTRLEAKGVRVQIEGPRSRLPFEHAYLHIDDANGLDHGEIWRVIDPIRGVTPGRRDLFWVVGI